MSTLSFRPLSALACAAALLAVTGPGARAHELSPDECLEAGDFIRNAALSRDFGITREEFIGRMEEDLVAIRAYPAELRWFAQDEDDEVLLRTAAEAVFDAPTTPAAHRDDFLRACFLRVQVTYRGR
jgi:hypothetical protein